MNSNIIFVPYWIEKALARNKYTLRDVVDYSVLRRFISQNDLSGLLSFQQSPVVDILSAGFGKSDTVAGYSTDSLLSRWEESAGQRYRDELDSTVVPMSHSLEKETLTRLKKSLDSTDIEDRVYKVVDIDKRSIVVVVYEGFIEEIKNPQTKYTLVKQLLTLSYVYCRVEEVSKSQLFRTYVDLLELATTQDNTEATVE